MSAAFDPATLWACWNTLVISTIAMAIALGLGLPLAFVLFRTDCPHAPRFYALLSALIAVPPFVLGMGWLQLCNPGSGLLNQWLGVSWFNIYGRLGIGLVLGLAELPLVLLPAKAALARIDASLEEAARLSGASPWRAVRDATLPLLLPAVVSGGVLVFLSAAAAFGVPYMLGVSATPPTPVITTRIYSHVLMGADGFSHATFLAGLLLVMATVVLMLNLWVSRRGRVALSAGKGVRVSTIALGRARPYVFVCVSALVSVVVLLPLAAILLTSLRENPSLPLAFSNLTVQHWLEILVSPRTLGAATRSLVYAGLAALFVATLALVAGLVLRGRPSRARLWALVSSWPYAVPGTVVAMALLVVFSMDLRLVVWERWAFVLALANTGWLLVLAYVVKYLALGSRTIGEAFEQLDPSLAEAARLSGASPTRAVVDVVLPLMKGAITAALVLTFLLIANELTMSVLLVPPGGDVLGTLLFDLSTYADPASASVIACALVIVVVALLSVSQMTRRRTHGF